MAWTECQYSRGAIDGAGHKLNDLSYGHPDRDDALEIINNWRSCHSYPLHIIAKTLQDRARGKVNQKALVARRIKRMSSISLKLEHNPEMKLSQMQDIGGCRTVLESVPEVERLVAVYHEAASKHPKTSGRPFIHKIYDYLKNPKPDGYRGVHLVMKYQSTSKTAYNNQRIEIQVRSRLQHAWATSVETCQTFTGQALKSKIKNAKDSWLRFFCLMSAAIAAREKSATVPGTPSQAADRKEEIRQIEKQEGIIGLLRGWSTAMRHSFSTGTSRSSRSVAYLLELDIGQNQLSIRPYQRTEMVQSHKDYLAREKATENDPKVQVVLVSADSVINLKRAYPNFYVDTTAFIRAIQHELA